MAYDYRPWNPEQIGLLPVDPSNWLSEEHVAYKLLDIINEMNMSAVRTRRVIDSRGAPGFDPTMMATLTLYCMLNGRFSSRSMARYCRDDLGARFLCGTSGLPEYRCFSRFRQHNGDALSSLFAESVRLCREVGLVDMSTLFGDGTILKANANSRKNIPYGKLDNEIAVIEERVKELFAEADRLDAIEDEQAPDDDDPSGRAERVAKRRAALHSANERLKALEKAKVQVEARAHEKKERWDSTASADRPHRKTPNGIPDDEERANLTDPDSRLMRLKNDSYAQGYNANIAVEASHQIIIGTSLSSDPTDYYQLEPTLESVKEVTGECPEGWAADAGFCTNANGSVLAENGISALLCPSRKPPELSDQQQSAESHVMEQIEPDMKLRQKMTLALGTKEGHEIYSKRKYTVEPVFGQMKGSVGNPRMLGFLTRGLENCRLEWLLHCAVHNIGKLMRYGPKSQHVTDPPRPKSLSRQGRSANIGQISLNMATV